MAEREQFYSATNHQVHLPYELERQRNRTKVMTDRANVPTRKFEKSLQNCRHVA